MAMQKYKTEFLGQTRYLETDAGGQVVFKEFERHLKSIAEGNENNCNWAISVALCNVLPCAEGHDTINPPHHQGAIECIDALESIGIAEDYCRGNAIKYLWRLGKKGDSLEDARKAQWHINRLIEQLEKEST